MTKRPHSVSAWAAVGKRSGEMRKETWADLCLRTRGLCRVSFDHALKYELPYSEALDMDAIYRNPMFQRIKKARYVSIRVLPRALDVRGILRRGMNRLRQDSEK